MEVQLNNEGTLNCVEDPSDVNTMIESLVLNRDVCFKSQQLGESEITNIEKREIAHELFLRSKINFLSRFGKYLKVEQLRLFEKYAASPEDGVEVEILLKQLRQSEEKHHRTKRNRRYVALQRLIDGNDYFSESEMMKRSPLLYDQLVGQYLTPEEHRLRDKAGSQDTFVKILLEGIERDNARAKRKQQEEDEDNAMEEEDSDEDDDRDDADKLSEKDTEDFAKPSTSTAWGEFPDMKDTRTVKDEFYPKLSSVFITSKERVLLKEEFTTLMHQRFLEGKDEDFDYDAVDNDDRYDNIEQVGNDEEDKYFDSEEPEDAQMEDGMKKVEESSEDELDIYMNALNQHPTVCALSKDFDKL